MTRLLLYLRSYLARHRLFREQAKLAKRELDRQPDWRPGCGHGRFITVRDSNDVFCTDCMEFRPGPQPRAMTAEIERRELGTFEPRGLDPTDVRDHPGYGRDGMAREVVEVFRRNEGL